MLDDSAAKKGSENVDSDDSLSDDDLSISSNEGGMASDEEGGPSVTQLMADMDLELAQTELGKSFEKAEVCCWSINDTVHILYRLCNESVCVLPFCNSYMLKLHIIIMIIFAFKQCFFVLVCVYFCVWLLSLWHWWCACVVLWLQVVEEERSEEQQEDLRPVDVDFNLVKNLLDSYSSQGGGAGPASNILGSLGVHVPEQANIDWTIVPYDLWVATILFNFQFSFFFSIFINKFQKNCLLSKMKCYKIFVLKV